MNARPIAHSIYSGISVNQFTLRNFVNGEQKYAFGSKERDTETGNESFEACFLDTDIGSYVTYL